MKIGSKIRGVKTIMNGDQHESQIICEFRTYVCELGPESPDLGL